MSFYPNLGSDIPPYLQYSIGHTNQTWYKWEGTTKSCKYQKQAIMEGNFGIWLPELRGTKLRTMKKRFHVFGAAMD